MRLLQQTEGARLFFDEGVKGAELIKVLDGSPPTDEQLLEFETELRVSARLNIRGIRRALRKGSVEGRPALYSSFFAGSTSRQALIAARQPVERVVQVGIQLATVVGSLHAARLVHGRLSPDAIQVDESFSEVEISNLGHATRLDQDRAIDGHAFAYSESARYASPEQTGRMNRPVDWRTDLYSIGAILYEMLTARAPLDATSPVELVHQLIAVEPAPPHQFESSTPHLLSAVVLKLLHKNPEERYQSAEGLSSDLRSCLDQLQSNKPADAFELGREDSAPRFRVPRKVYGRDEDLGQLMDAFKSTAAGSTELVLVSGAAGVGKSTLVNEIQQPLAARRGRFVAGKFVHLKADLPFSAFSQAFQQWTDLVLADSEEELQRQRTRIEHAVGDLGGLLTSLVPDLELIIGEQAEVAELPPQQALNRFQYVLGRFTEAIADAQRPLVLFIDDLQWADPASMQLLSQLIMAPETSHLLIIGAYRDDEVTATHPFMSIMDSLERSGAAIRRIHLGPLQLPAVVQLVADALSSDAASIEPLAARICAEAQGNALFVGELLSSLYNDQRLSLNATTGQWEWELGESNQGGVLDLIRSKAEKLPDATRTALVCAACLGIRFELSTLAHALGMELSQTAQALEPAIQQGLLVPYGTGHRYVEAGLAPAEDARAGYVFPHDRVQEAIYALLSEEDRAREHLRLGNLFLEHGASKSVFDVISQLNLGRSLVDGPEECRRYAEINLRAVKEAKRAAAYAAALEYATIGIELLGATRWERDHAMTLELHIEAAECAYLAAEIERMDDLSTSVFEHSKNVLERMRIYHLLVDAYTSQNRLGDAVSVGRDALAELGLTFPKEPKLASVMLGVGGTKIRLMRKNIPALAQQQEMSDVSMLEAMLLLDRMIPPAYMSGSLLFPLLVFSMVNLSVKHGNSPYSPIGYASFAITLSGVLGDIRSGEQFGELSLNTLEHLQAEPARTKVYFILYVFIRHWTQPLSACTEPLLEAYYSGMRTGNLVGATWSAYYRLLWFYYCGRPLPGLELEAGTYSAIFERLGQDAAFRRCEMLRQVALNLMGRTDDPIAFRGGTYDDAEIEKLGEFGDDATSLFFYHYNKQTLCFLFGRTEDAVTHGDACKKLLLSVTGLPDMPLWCFWDALSRIRRSEKSNSPASKKLRAQARAHGKKLAKWASFGAANYQHKHHLVCAELARVAGDYAIARDLYDRAIEGAIANDYPQEAALAQELAGRFHLGRESRELGNWYLRRAHEGWFIWGANAKADALEAEFSEVFVSKAESTDAASARAGDAIDLASVVKATVALSGEIELERLAATLLDILVENAGAQQGALILFEGNTGRVFAHKARADGPVKTGLDVAISGGTLVPESVLNYVARSQRPLVIDDASKEPRFASDPYILSNHTRSVLCAPVVHQGELRAALYLQNNLAPQAFTNERVELLRMLGGQIAVSLENAKLYANLQGALDKQVSLTKAYSRFTPQVFLDFLGRESILDVALGDQMYGDMTVVFLDIRSYTTLSEKMTPAENFAFIESFLRHLSPHIASNNGVVQNFLGDGLMAFFPKRPEDALDACIGMQHAVRELNASREAKGRLPIKVGMGMHTGPLMIGIIGDRDRMDTALVSDTVNTAARMEGLTKFFEVGIVASDGTIDALSDPDKYGLRPIGVVKVKGKEQVYRVYDCFDGDSDSMSTNKRASVTNFRQAMEHWQSADFSKARACFERVLSANPGDETASRYVARCRDYEDNGPPEGWSGIDIQ